MSDASNLIRASIAALPAGDRGAWSVGDREVTAVVDENGLVIFRLDRALQPHVAHIALLASPDVAAAVADLLDAANDFREPVVGDRITESGDHAGSIRRLRAAAQVVEAAITRAGGTS